MKVKERVRYGSRGQGSLIRYEGVHPWYSCYYVRGKEVRQSTGNADLKAAKRIHRGLLDALAADRQGARRFVTPSEARATVGELVTALEADYQLRGVRSLAQVRAHLGIPVKAGDPPRTILAAFGAWRAADLTAEAVDRYIERRLAQGTAPATVNRETQLLGQALRLGLRRRVLISAPEIRRLPEDNVREVFFSRAELEAVVRHLPDDLHDFCRWGYLTSWRKGEIVSLTWADVDVEGRTIRLSWRKSKNKKARTMVLAGELAAIIDRRSAARTALAVKGAITDRVFFRDDGRLVGDFRKAWFSACIKADLFSEENGKKVHARVFHDFRRSGIRNMKRAGVEETVAMRISGHRTRSVFDRYNITDEDDVKDAVLKTQAYVETLPTAAPAPPDERDPSFWPR